MKAGSTDPSVEPIFILESTRGILLFMVWYISSRLLPILILVGLPEAVGSRPSPFNVLLRVAASPIAEAQNERTSAVQYTLRVNADEVVLNCTVLDNKGELVNTLKRDDFKISEDKVPQKIISLQHQDVPVSIGLLVDNSGSMRPKKEAVSAAALALIRASNPQDETFVMNFSDKVYLDQDFTSDLAKLREGLAHANSNGGTALYDTIVMAAGKMQRSASRARHVLIVITDGQDNASKETLENTIHSVQDMQSPIVYSIGLLFNGEDGRGEIHRAKHDLQALSNETGGIAFFPSSLQDIDRVAAEVARDIRNQYTLAYHSTRTAIDGYHSIKVEARRTEPGKLVVHTRSGYLLKRQPGR